MRSKLPVYISFLIVGSIFGNCQTEKTPVSKGKIEMTISLNGEPVPYFDDVYFLFDGHYMLEENSSQPINMGSPRKSTPGVPDKSKRYILTNLQTKRVAEFEYTEAAWKVVSQYPVNDKKFGLQFAPEVPQIAGYSKNFIYRRDTVLGNRLCKVLVDTLSRPNPVGNKLGTVQKTVVYLESGRQNIPISISTLLDEKFGGWSYRIDMQMEIDDPNSRQKQSYFTVYQMNLTDEVSEQFQSLMDKLKMHL